MEMPLRRAGTDHWLHRPVARPNAKLRLFCLGYAGSGARLFRPWAMAMPAEIELVAIRLPGRENRIKEAPYSEWRPLLDALTLALSEATARPYLVFGQCLGGMICYELCLHLAAMQRRPPERLLLAGCPAPHTPSPVPVIHHLPDTEFDAGLREWYLVDAPADVLDNRNMMDLLTPMYRADIKLGDTWPRSRPSAPQLPLTVFAGDRDSMAPVGSVQAWSDYSRAGFRSYVLPGKHFFTTSTSFHDRLQDELTLCLRETAGV